MGEKEHREVLHDLQTALEEERLRVRSMRDAAAEQIGNARSVLRACAGSLEKGQSELDTLIAASESRLQHLDEHISGLDFGAESQERIASLEQELETSQTRYVEMEKALEEQSAVSDQLRESEEKCATLESEASSARERVEGLSKELELAKTAEGERTAELKKSLEKAEESRRALEKDKARLEESLEAVKVRADDAEAGCEKMQESVTALRAEVDEWRGLAENAEKETAELDSLRAELDATKTKLADEEAAHGAIAEEIKAARKETEQLRAQLNDGLNAEEADRLRQALEQSRAEVDALKTDLDNERSRGNKSALAAQLAEALRDAEQAHAELRVLRESGGDAPSTTPAVRTHRLSDDEQVARVVEAAKSNGGQGKKTIGELLVGAGVVTQDQMDEAIESQKHNPQQHVGAILIEKQLASESAVAQALAAQCGVDFVRIDDDRVDAEAAGLISERLANQHVCIPIEASGNRMVLAMQNPLDLVAIEDIERSTGKHVEYVVATPQDIRAAIGKYYWEPE